MNVRRFARSLIDSKLETFLNTSSLDLNIWVYSLMDRITGFGPVDRGSNPRRPIYLEVRK